MAVRKQSQQQPQQPSDFSGIQPVPTTPKAPMAEFNFHFVLLFPVVIEVVNSKIFTPGQTQSQSGFVQPTMKIIVRNTNPEAALSELLQRPYVQDQRTGETYIPKNATVIRFEGATNLDGTPVQTPHG